MKMNLWGHDEPHHDDPTTMTPPAPPKLSLIFLNYSISIYEVGPFHFEHFFHNQMKLLKKILMDVQIFLHLLVHCFTTPLYLF